MVKAGTTNNIADLAKQTTPTRSTTQFLQLVYHLRNGTQKFTTIHLPPRATVESAPRNNTSARDLERAKGYLTQIV
jgi:hypothetical protein